MKIQWMLSNAEWVDLDPERIPEFVSMILEREPWFAPRRNRQPMTTQAEVLEYLATGKTIYYDSDWYAQLRDLDAFEPVKFTTDFPYGKKLSCGHVVFYRSHILNSSRGTSCQDCYDRMSN